MVTVIAILVILMLAGVSLLGGTGAQSRRTATDMLTGMIEQARTSAITSRRHVVLAVAEPGTLPTGDDRTRVGLFKVDSWDSTGGPVSGVLMSRWKTLENGVVLIGGEVDGLENPMDKGELSIIYNSAKPVTVKVRAIGFNPRGGLHFPAGSAPVVFRLAEGSYRGGKATPFLRGDPERVAENLLKIGRVIARPYRID